MKNELFSIGPFTVYGYGLMIAIGIIAAYLAGEYRAKKYGLEADHVFNYVIWCVVGGFSGSKLLYFITNIKNITTISFNISIFFPFLSDFVISNLSYYFLSYSIPKWSYACFVTTLPLVVLTKNPICSKYGSYTSSIVPISSPIVALKVSIPTGPPL